MTPGVETPKAAVIAIGLHRVHLDRAAATMPAAARHVIDEAA
jgi:hypothetical protein